MSSGVATDAVVDGVINYTKTAVKDDWFVEINGLSMAGVDIDIDDKHVGAVDTGTTGIYMPNEVLDAIFANVEGAEYMPEIGRYSFPCSAPNLNLTFTLNGIDYPLYWGDLIWSSQGGRCYGNLYGNGHLTSNFQG
jgi:hypothetical protein